MATAALKALAMERAVRFLAEGRDALAEAGRDGLDSRADALVEEIEDVLAGGAGAALEPDVDDGFDGDYDQPYPDPCF